MQTLNTNIVIQYGEPVPQGKSNSLEVVTFPWINVSGYNFNIMNTLHEIYSQASLVLGKTCSIFQITTSKVPVKSNKIYSLNTGI